MDKVKVSAFVNELWVSVFGYVLETDTEHLRIKHETVLDMFFFSYESIYLFSSLLHILFRTLSMNWQ